MVQMVKVALDSDFVAGNVLFDQKKCGFFENKPNVSIQQTRGDYFVYVRVMGTTDHLDGQTSSACV